MIEGENWLNNRKVIESDIKKEKVVMTPVMPERFRLIREKLLAEFSGDLFTKGLNLKRVENFIQSKDLEVKKYIVLNRKSLKRVNEIVGSTNLLRSVFSNKDNFGAYIPEIDLVLLLRNESEEKFNGTIFTEGLLIHELAHATSSYQYQLISDTGTKFHTPRIGFCLPQAPSSWGWLLEEGWADMCRVNYIIENISEREKRTMQTSEKFGILDLNDTIPIEVADGHFLPLPLKYIYIADTGRTTTTAALAGYTMELICKKYSSVELSIIEARDSVQGLRKLVNAFQRIQPGLYKKLQNSNYSQSDFIKLLSFIIDEHMGGIEKVIVAKGLLKKEWGELLNKKAIYHNEK